MTSAQPQSRRILVVDDRPDILGFVRLGLQRAGYAVEVAANGREALERQRARAADVLITDIFMPEVDGIETIDRFRREWPATRIIAMSSGAAKMQDYLRIATHLGVDATLPKPFSVDELLHAVRSVL